MNTSSIQQINSNRLWYDVGMVATVLVWGVNVGISKHVLTAMSPMLFNVLRFGLSAGLMGLLVRYTALGQARDGAPVPLIKIIQISLLGHVFYQLCFVFSLKFAPSGNVALMLASSPLWTAFSGWLLKTETISRRTWGGLVFSFLGVVLVLASGTHKFGLGLQVFWGNLLALGAAIAWGFYTSLSKPLMEKIPPVRLKFQAMACALPFHILFSIVWGGFQWTWIHEGQIWLGVLFSGFLSIGFAYVVWNLAVQKIGASNASAYSNLVPFVALLFGSFVLHEQMNLLQWLGGMMILSGLFWMRRKA